jgi:hypothetical protein
LIPRSLRGSRAQSDPADVDRMVALEENEKALERERGEHELRG